jgi:hypothetical protein
MSLFSDHIEKTVSRLPQDVRDAAAQALIRERAAEARHVAERMRTYAAKIPGAEALIQQLEDRASKLEAIAAQWPAKKEATRQ